MKQILKLFLILCMMFSIMSIENIHVHAEDSDFVIDENGVLLEYLGDDAHVVVPEGVVAIKDGYDSFHSGVFHDNRKIESVELPCTLERIGNYAFARCDNLKRVNIPDGVRYIGWGAFEGTKLEEIVIPNSVKEIGAEAFGGIYAKEIIIPDSVESFGYKSFSSFYLEKVTLPSGMKSIPASAFSNSYVLNEVIFPKELIEIREKAFLEVGIEYLELPNKLEVIHSQAFEYCNKLKELVLPSSLKVVDDRAFWANSIEALYVPEGVEQIGCGAFSGPKMTDIYLPRSLTTIDEEWIYPTGEEYNFPAWREQTVAHVYEGSYAHQFCVENNRKYVLRDDVSLRNPSLNVIVGESLMASDWFVLDEMYTVHDFTYSSSDNSVIGVDEQGNLIANGTGKATVSISLNEKVIKSIDVLVREINVEGVTRNFGNNRYETAFKVADTLKDTLGVEKFDAVIIGNGTNFADALAGSYLSSKKNAPILMTDKSNKNITNLANYIKANIKDGGTVYILGGTAAVSNNVEKQLKGYNVVRLAGKDRYETNLKILSEAGVTTEDLLVCTGTNFADSLSASATGLPMLLVGKSLNDNQVNFLNTLNDNQIYIIGGTGAVNSKIETKLKSYGDVKRLAGSNRYATSVLVAETFFEKPVSAVLAYGQNFPDGLSGGALAYALRSPLLLVENKQVNTIASYTKEVGITSGYVLGGSGLISNTTKENVFDPDYDPLAGVSQTTTPNYDNKDELTSWTPEEVPVAFRSNGGVAFATKAEANAWAKAQVNDSTSKWFGYGYLLTQVPKGNQPVISTDPWIVKFY